MTIQRCECGHQQRVRAARPEDEGATFPAKAAPVGAVWASFAAGIFLLTASVMAVEVAWATAAGLAAKTAQSEAPRVPRPRPQPRRAVTFLASGTG